MQITNPSSGMVLNSQTIADLKVLARENPRQNAAAVAHQFESLLVGLLLKESHKDNLGGKLFESHATELAQELLDQEVGLHVAQKANLGFDKLLMQAIPQGSLDSLPRAGQQRSGSGQALQQGMLSVDMHDLRHGMPAARMPAPRVVDGTRAAGDGASQRQPWSREAFVAALQGPIATVAGQLGVDARALMAQAALESGWGRRILQLPNGQSSCNVFNIKADPAWTGPAVAAAAVEDEGGIAVLHTSRFRVYGSLQESVADYADFLRRNPRYQEALRQQDAAEYIAALAKAGYATDHGYVAKVLGVMEHPAIQAIATSPSSAAVMS